MIEKSAFRTYFAKRLVELYDKNSLDSYRVRSHNSLSAILELISVCEGWKDYRIKSFDTVLGSIEEVEILLKKEKCISYSTIPEVVINDLFASFKKSKARDQVGKVVFALEKLYDENKEQYLQLLIQKIESYINIDDVHDDNQYTPLFDDFDLAIGSFACELINKGYSKSYLHQEAKSLQVAEDFSSAYSHFKSTTLQFERHHYKVLLRLYLEGNAKNIAWPHDFVNDIPEEILSEYFTEDEKDKLPEPKPNIKYLIEEIDDLDPIRAIFAVKAKAHNILDFYHLGMNSLKVKIVNAFVCQDQNESKSVLSRKITMSPLDGVYPNNLSKTTTVRDRLMAIVQSKVLNSEAKSRLESACRHLRVANNSQEIEQSFINYWIALEFLYSSPSNDENTIGRLKENLVNIMLCGYANRNLKYFNRWLQQKEYISKDTQFWTKDNIDEIINSVDCYMLKYKLLKQKSFFWNTTTSHAEKYLSAHQKNVELQIVRIYRVRNELIHEAAIRQDIERITSNLRYYLMFTINQMIDFFSSQMEKGNTCGMDEFFYEYQLRKDILMKNPTKEVVMSMPLHFDIVN